MLLGDFGAEVIKIEPPEGDHSRKWGTARYGEADEFSGLYLALNRNKASVVLDLKTAEGQARIHHLLKTADVVIENFRPGVASRLGVGYEHAMSIKPDVIYCSISGFGQNGPLSDRPGFDNLIQAYVGQMALTGEPGRPSVRTAISANDILAAAHAAYGIMLALVHRMKTGEGQYVDTSLYDTGIHLLAHYVADYTGSGRTTEKSGPYFPFLAPYGAFQAADREFYLGCGNDKLFASFCEAIERADLLADPRFASNGSRVEHSDTLYAELGRVFVTRPARHWVDAFLSYEIPSSLLHDVAEVVDDQEQARVRDMIVPVGVGTVCATGIPIKLSRTPGQIRRPPPSLGADTNLVLDDSGFTPEVRR